MSKKAIKRSVWATALVAFLGAMSQAPWGQLLDLANQLLGNEPDPAPAQSVEAE